MSRPDKVPEVVRVGPYQYIHVLDQNTNVTRLEGGPQVFVRKDNEKIITNVMKYVTIPPRHYCTIRNPVVKEDDEVKKDKFGCILLQFGDREIRFHQDPFPLYPGEELLGEVSKLKVVRKDQAFRLVCLDDFTEEDGTERIAGDEWLFQGPQTFIPRKEIDFISTVSAITINPLEALRIKAKREMKDWQGKSRVAGEEWLIRKTGNYMPGPYEEIVKTLTTAVLTDCKAIHMKAVANYTDFTGKDRKTGEEWLVTKADCESIIPEVNEEIVRYVSITTLTSRQYCIIHDTVDENFKNQLGKKLLKRGEVSFFLHPGETIPEGIKSVHVLGENDGLVLRAVEEFQDKDEERKAGDRWMIKGPCEYVPTVESEIERRHQNIPLGETEGIYVRDIKTGKVRSVVGQTYMLTENEELWEKNLPAHVQNLLNSGLDPVSDRNRRINLDANIENQRRDMHKRAMPRELAAGEGMVRNSASDTGYYIPPKAQCVTLEVPHNAAVQLYDYKSKVARVVFGPDLVLLEPDEQFTVLSLSGDKPKKPGVIKTLVLLLGPDFCTDYVEVETVDHARLRLNVSYNWFFDVEKAKSAPEEAAKLFAVPDFVGDMCKSLASRIRGAVAGVSFDNFHKNSARIIRGAVLGFDRTSNKVLEKFEFPSNLLSVTSVDIQCVEPVDQRTKDSLMKSVQLAIEITTNAQEASAKHEAQKIEQEAKGKLERQRINDEAQAEKARQALLQLQTQSAALESTGQAKAEAESRAEAAKIEGEANVEQSRLRAEAAKIESEAELERLKQARNDEIEYLEKKNKLELEKQKESTAIEINKFKQMVDSMGADTIKAMASAGQDHQVEMLKALGLTSTLITDGRTPINLLNAAHGFVNPTAATATITEENN